MVRDSLQENLGLALDFGGAAPKMRVEVKPMYANIEQAAVALDTWERVSCYCWHKPGLFLRLCWIGHYLYIAELKRTVL